MFEFLKRRSPKDPRDSLSLAFATSGQVKTIGGGGELYRRPLADLVLPTGKIGIGYPGEGEMGRIINTPSNVVPTVPPGRYPVFISLATSKGSTAFAFLSVLFNEASPTTWESAGGFFTDSGDGAIYDASLTDVLRLHYRDKGEAFYKRWWEIKRAAHEDGDGNLILDPTTGANAIIFATNDFGYPAYMGKDATGRSICLVIDGRSRNR